MSIIIDEQAKKNFEKEGVKSDTAFAFAHLFAFIEGKTDLEPHFREKFEEMGLLTPENELRMDEIESDLEWILLTSIYEGKIERVFDETEKCFKYKNTEIGNAEAIKMIRELANKS